MAISNTPKIGSISFWQSLVAKSHVKIFVAITDTKRLTDCPKNYDEILRKQKTLLSWPNRLFQKDRDKTASAARILSPNPKRQPLPCLLNKSFFYGGDVCVRERFVYFDFVRMDVLYTWTFCKEKCF